MIEQPLNQWCLDTQNTINDLKLAVGKLKATQNLLIGLEIATLVAVIGLIIH